MLIFATIFVFFLSFSQRILTSFFVNTDFDTHGHLHVAQQVKRQGCPAWGSVKLQCWEAEEYFHPYMWHKMLALFPIERIYRYQRFINGALDAIFSTAVFLICYFVDETIYTAFMGLGLYLFSPMWFSYFSMGPRIQSFTPRLSSEIIMNLIILCHFFYMTKLDNHFLFIILIILNTLLLLISKFGLQSQVFITTCYTVITFDFSLITTLLISIAVTYLISGGGVHETFRRQIIHLKEYFHKNKTGINPISKRNSFKEILAQFKGDVTYKALIWHILAVNSYTSTLIKLPIVALFFHHLVLYNNSFSSAPLTNIGLASILIFTLINTRMFLFLGEAERYLNHTAVAFIIPLLTFASQNQNYIWITILIAYGIVFWMLEILYLYIRSSHEPRVDADKLIEKFLLSLPTERIVLSYPYHNFCSYRVMLNTQHKSILPLHANMKSRNSFIKKYEYKNPFCQFRRPREYHC